jgi:hypothetical protein
MTRVFLSYRRDDSFWPSSRIHESLIKRPEGIAVFFDIDDIKPGEDFVDKLSSQVSSCDLLLAVIGTTWISSVDREGRHRLDQDKDFVRIEIETALKRRIPLIPVLVDGAAMPDSTQLPEALSELARRQAFIVSQIHFNSDVETLATRALELVKEDRLRRREAWDEAQEADKQRQFQQAKHETSVLSQTIRTTEEDISSHLFDKPFLHRQISHRLIAIMILCQGLFLEYALLNTEPGFSQDLFLLFFVPFFAAVYVAASLFMTTKVWVIKQTLGFSLVGFVISVVISAILIADMARGVRLQILTVSIFSTCVITGFTVVWARGILTNLAQLPLRKDDTKLA